VLGRIDYDIEKYQFTEAGETSRLREQWREVYQECRQLQAGAEERLRIALLNVDYVTSFELPFRLLLVRAPQLIADVRETLQLSRKAAVFNGKRYGCVYSLKQDLQAVPESFHYHLTNRIRRVEATGQTAAPYQQIAREIKPARDRLRQALIAGLPVTALDALFWFGSQRRRTLPSCAGPVWPLSLRRWRSATICSIPPGGYRFIVWPARERQPSPSRCLCRQSTIAPSNQTHRPLAACRGAGSSHALAMSMTSISASGTRLFFSLPFSTSPFCQQGSGKV
jgi:hypothetical protein